MCNFGRSGNLGSPTLDERKAEYMYADTKYLPALAISFALVDGIQRSLLYSPFMKTFTALAAAAMKRSLSSPLHCASYTMQKWLMNSNMLTVTAALFQDAPGSSRFPHPPTVCLSIFVKYFVFLCCLHQDMYILLKCSNRMSTFDPGSNWTSRQIAEALKSFPTPICILCQMSGL